MLEWIILGILVSMTILSLVTGFFTKKSIFNYFALFFLFSGFTEIKFFIFQPGIFHSNEASIYLFTFCFLFILIAFSFLSAKALKVVYAVASQNESETITNLDQNFIVLKSKAVLSVSEIQFVKSDGPFVEYYILGKMRPEVDRNSLKNVLRMLSDKSFFQIHKSILVNQNHIVKMDQEEVHLNGHVLPISKLYGLGN